MELWKTLQKSTSQEVILHRFFSSLCAGLHFSLARALVHVTREFSLFMTWFFFFFGLVHQRTLLFFFSSGAVFLIVVNTTLNHCLFEMAYCLSLGIPDKVLSYLQLFCLQFPPWRIDTASNCAFSKQPASQHERFRSKGAFCHWILVLWIFCHSCFLVCQRHFVIIWFEFLHFSRANALTRFVFGYPNWKGLLALQMCVLLVMQI